MHVAVTATGSQTDSKRTQSVGPAENLSSALEVCQDYLYDDNYGKKQNTEFCFLTGYSSQLRHFWWLRPITALCLLFFFISLFTFPFLCSQPCLPPCFLLLYPSFFVINMYHIDLSPLFFFHPCPLLPSSFWHFNRPSYCCCSSSRERPTPCWDWGTACFRSHTGKWPQWPKWPRGRRHCGGEETTQTVREIVNMGETNRHKMYTKERQRRWKRLFPLPSGVEVLQPEVRYKSWQDDG